MENMVPGLKDAIRKANIMQNELAEIIDVSPLTVSRWVQGKAEPSLSTVMELSRVLKCKPQELLGLDLPNSTSIGGCRIETVDEKDGDKILTIVVEGRKKHSPRPVVTSFANVSLRDIFPEIFRGIADNIAKEIHDIYALISLRKGRIRKKLAEEGLSAAHDYDLYKQRENQLLSAPEMKSLFARSDEAEEAELDLNKPIGMWKRHVLALSGWTGALFEQKEVTVDDINSMKEGTEYWSEGTVTLEDGKVYSEIPNDNGYYAGTDGSIIAGVEVIRLDANGEPCKIEGRLGYIIVKGKGSYDPAPY